MKRLILFSLLIVFVTGLCAQTGRSNYSGDPYQPKDKVVGDTIIRNCFYKIFNDPKLGRYYITTTPAGKLMKVYINKK